MNENEYCNVLSSPLVLSVASPWQGGVPGRSERSTSGMYTPGRVTQDVKVTPLFPAITNRHKAKTVFYLMVLRSSDYRSRTFPRMNQLTISCFGLIYV
ncbi:hypothetical protein AVEN_271664-1 [Araneus ventricosus]|uniref:Uncharacterized protein n=1 Tax=Araneus ventricosus TaxID=182803 RepID=A0A4Y2U4B5_ARAVE|nr:hypothetical protein AVEN_69883-1 [Araneus ventricosus]GBO07864.1 hypothetical protein AVEN_271664-1 [Araneus ventricosus]